MRILLTAIIFSLFCIPPSIGHAEPYFDQNFQFSISFPEGWVVKRSPNPETIIKAVYRDRLDRIAQIAIAAYDLQTEFSKPEGDRLTADDMWEGLEGQYPDFTMDRKDFGVGKIRSQKVVWNLVEITEPPQARMIAKHYHFIRGRYLYRVSASSDSGIDFFESALPVMEKSISSFAFGL